MGTLNGYINENERTEAEKAKGLFAIASAIDGLANAIIQANREKLEALKEVIAIGFKQKYGVDWQTERKEVANADNAQEDD